MYFTTELRWFRPGEAPASARDWLGSIAGPATARESRVDHYLSVPGYDGMGLKLREARIEIKVRESQHGLVKAGDRIVGRAETWCKWSFELTDAVDGVSGVRAVDSLWVPVAKQRWLKRYCIRPDGVATPIPAAEPDPATCALELVQIRAAGQDWWSLAFEALGRGAKGMNDLLQTVRHVLEAHHPFGFGANESFSYPFWLCRRLKNCE